jgi:hypothetical protein
MKEATAKQHAGVGNRCEVNGGDGVEEIKLISGRFDDRSNSECEECAQLCPPQYSYALASSAATLYDVGDYH